MDFLYTPYDKTQYKILYSAKNYLFFSDMDMADSHTLAYKEVSEAGHVRGVLELSKQLKNQCYAISRPALFGHGCQ